MTVIPLRDQLRAEFDAAVIHLDQSRTHPMLTTEFYKRIGDSMFDAGYRALQDFVVHRHPDFDSPTARMHVVSEQEALEWFRRAAHIALECGLLLDALSHVVLLALQDGLNGHFETYDPGCEAVAELRPEEAHTALAAEASRLRLAAA